MSTKQVQDIVTKTGFRKDPDDWVTGQEKASPGQLSFLTTLASECGERFPPEYLSTLTKAKASGLIQEYIKKRAERQSNPTPLEDVNQSTQPRTVSQDGKDGKKPVSPPPSSASEVEAWIDAPGDQA